MGSASAREDGSWIEPSRLILDGSALS